MTKEKIKENINLILDNFFDGERANCEESMYDEFEFDDSRPEDMTDEELLAFGNAHNFEHIFLKMLELKKQLEEL